MQLRPDFTEQPIEGAAARAGYASSFVHRPLSMGLLPNTKASAAFGGSAQLSLNASSCGTGLTSPAVSTT